MPYHNNLDYLNQSIDSVLNQSYGRIELIIIYDDMNLSGLEIINVKKKKDKRIKLIINKRRLGAGYSRNKGIKASKGTYIAFIDSDDIWTKKKIEIQIKYIKANNLSFLHTSYVVIDSYGKQKKIVHAKKNIDYKDLINSCDIGLSTVMIKSNIIKKNLFPKLKTKEDYVVWLKLAKKNIKLIGLNSKTTYWRKLNNSLSSSVIQRIIDAFKVYKNYEKKSILLSIFLIFNLSINAVKKKYFKL